MSAALGALSGIRSRIASLETRFGAERTEQLTIAGSEEFDAFGETYQQALAAVQAAPPVATASVADSVASWRQSFDTLTNATSSFHSTGVTGGVNGGVISVSDPAVANAINGGGAAGARTIGGYGSMPVPSELQAFGNGKVPATSLTTIGQGGHRLYAPAAASWDNLVAAAAADGFDMRITDSYRSYDEQVDLAQRKGLYKDGGLAATPGTSNHGWGMAVDADLLDPEKLAWMRENGPRFGWIEAVPREPWHWEFRPHEV